MSRADSESKQKLRWWQFSLRNYVLLLTLFSVLTVAGYRLREKGRELYQERMRIADREI